MAFDHAHHGNSREWKWWVLRDLIHARVASFLSWYSQRVAWWSPLKIMAFRIRSKKFFSKLNPECQTKCRVGSKNKHHLSAAAAKNCIDRSTWQLHHGKSWKIVAHKCGTMRKTCAASSGLYGLYISTRVAFLSRSSSFPCPAAGWWRRVRSYLGGTRSRSTYMRQRETQKSRQKKPEVHHTHNIPGVWQKKIRARPWKADFPNSGYSCSVDNEWWIENIRIWLARGVYGPHR